MHNSRLLSIALIGALYGCVPSEEHAQPLAIASDLQAIVDDAVAQGVTLGAVVNVSEADGSSTALAGIAERATGRAMVEDDHFRAGSIMKTFVATAVLQAFEADKLRLDDVITKYLPGEITGRIANAEAITLHMLLSHRSGIAEWDTPDIDLRIAQTPTYIWTLDEILNLAAKNGPAFSPGQQYGYSNTNYALLGEILTRISGRDWRDVVREGVFAPARLHDTYLPQPGDHTCAEPCAHGYLELNDALVDLSNVDPSMAGSAGGHQLITTAADLTRFFEKLQGGALFRNASTLQTMFDFAVAPEPDSYITGYGLGMAKFEGDGFLAYGHLGGTAGYQSFMLYVPATKRYLTGFINLYGGLGDFLVPLLVRTQQP